MKFLKKETRLIEKEAIIRRVVSKYNTPCYIYFHDNILYNIQRFRSLFAFPVKLFFPVMTNDNPEILRILSNNDSNFFANSISNIEIMLRAGIAPRKMTFASSNCDIMAFEILQSLSAIQFNANSVSQIKQYLTASNRSYVGARINLLSLLKMFGKEHKFRKNLLPTHRLGIPVKELQALLDSGNDIAPKINGFHIYAGTKISDAHFLADCYECLVRFAGQYKEIKYLNFGGGFPIYTECGTDGFDWDFYAKKVHELRKALRADMEIQIEPGRTIIGDAAVFLASITDLYRTDRKNYIGTDASINIFPRPFYYRDKAYADHPVTLLRNNSEKFTNSSRYTICGQSTYSGDILLPNAYLDNPAIGDYLMFENAGAYCSSMRNAFLSSFDPLEILVRDNRFSIIRGEPKKAITERFLMKKGKGANESGKVC